jgi:hypothetical protein
VSSSTGFPASNGENKDALGSPWRRGIVVIAFASRTEDPGFESRQRVRLNLRSLYIGVLLSKT